MQTANRQSRKALETSQQKRSRIQSSKLRERYQLPLPWNSRIARRNDCTAAHVVRVYRRRYAYLSPCLSVLTLCTLVRCALCCVCLLHHLTLGTVSLLSDVSVCMCCTILCPVPVMKASSTHTGGSQMILHHLIRALPHLPSPLFIHILNFNLMTRSLTSSGTPLWSGSKDTSDA